MASAWTARSLNVKIVDVGDQAERSVDRRRDLERRLVAILVGRLLYVRGLRDPARPRRGRLPWSFLA
jgi:hypothetical protein